MPAFRPSLLVDDRPLALGAVATVCAALTRPDHFFVGRLLSLTVRHVSDEEIFWELFHGHALDRAQTRRKQRFESWNVSVPETQGESADEPLISVKCDVSEGIVFVTRAILCHGHESVDRGGNVFETRETVRWVRELVGSIRLADCLTRGAFVDELACLLFQAIVGTSRLPLTSLEAPLPMFSLGQLGYVYRPDPPPGATPLRDPRDLLAVIADPCVTFAERARHLELCLRAADLAELPGIAASALRCGSPTDPFAMLKEMLNGVTLSPYTDFAAKTLAIPRLAVTAGLASTADAADFYSHLLRQLSRHLTAYDLITFHHRGANYPDALLLDDILWEVRSLAAPPAPLRRRGLRLGLVLRAEYSGHPVPDAPTSPGENARVLPAPYARVPDDQIFAPTTRRRRLFPDEMPGDDERIRDLLRDLDDPRELAQLGTALFLDRPLGAAKQPGEPDQTLLMAHVLFSRSVAVRRIRELARRPELLPGPGAVERWTEIVAPPAAGIPFSDPGPPPRPGVVSLHDAVRVADDWLILSTTRRAIADLMREYDFDEFLRAGTIPAPATWRIVVPAADAGGWSLLVYDQHFRPILELRPDYSDGYRTRGGSELVAAGLQVVVTGEENWDGARIRPRLDGLA